MHHWCYFLGLGRTGALLEHFCCRTSPRKAWWRINKWNIQPPGQTDIWRTCSHHINQTISTTSCPHGEYSWLEVAGKWQGTMDITGFWQARCYSKSSLIKSAWDRKIRYSVIQFWIIQCLWMYTYLLRGWIKSWWFVVNCDCFYFIE